MLGPRASALWPARIAGGIGGIVLLARPMLGLFVLVLAARPEAMALGTPVVSTAKGAEGLDVTDGEHLLLADDPETFARRTVELLSDADLRQRLAANARRLVEQRYDWDAIGRRFVAPVEEMGAQCRALPLFQN